MSQLDALMLLQVQLHRRVDHGVAARLSSSVLGSSRWNKHGFLPSVSD